MGIFFRIFQVFDKNKPHKDLLEVYSQLNEIAVLLQQNLQVLRELQKQIIEKRLEKAKISRKPTGVVGFEKTLFIEEKLVDELKKLAVISEKRFLALSEELGKAEPVDKEERSELEKIFNFLQKIKNLLPSLEALKKLPEKEQFRLLETGLREITNVSKEFYEIEQRKKELVRKIEENEISHLLKDIYRKPKHIPQDPNILVYFVTPYQLRSLEEESKKINMCQDPNYKIEWARWWREIQIPEKDKRTALKDPHINVTIKLFGGPKNDIHLLLKAA